MYNHTACRMMSGGNWCRANEISVGHLTNEGDVGDRWRDKTLSSSRTRGERLAQKVGPQPPTKFPPYGNKQTRGPVLISDTTLMDRIDGRSKQSTWPPGIS